MRPRDSSDKLEKFRLRDFGAFIDVIDLELNFVKREAFNTLYSSGLSAGRRNGKITARIPAKEWTAEKLAELKDSIRFNFNFMRFARFLELISTRSGAAVCS